jgi:hypothetical protein
MSNDKQPPDSVCKVHKSKVLNCTICLEDIISDLRFLPCIHAFHGECINTWIREQPVCPICKVPVYVNTTDQLDRYNRHKSHQDRIADEEAMFFQELSADVYNNEPRVDYSYLQYDLSIGLNTFPIVVPIIFANINDEEKKENVAPTNAFDSNQITPQGIPMIDSNQINNESDQKSNSGVTPMQDLIELMEYLSPQDQNLLWQMEFPVSNRQPLRSIFEETIPNQPLGESDDYQPQNEHLYE